VKNCVKFIIIPLLAILPLAFFTACSTDEVGAVSGVISSPVFVSGGNIVVPDNHSLVKAMTIFDEVLTLSVYDINDIEIEKGMLALNLGNPRNSALKTVALTGVTADPSDAKGLFILLFMDAKEEKVLVRFNEFDKKIVCFFYADKPVNVSGVNTDVNGEFHDFELNLKRGWNPVIVEYFSAQSRYKYSLGSQNSSFIWGLYNYSELF